MRIWSIIACLLFLIGFSAAWTGFAEHDLRYSAVAVMYGFMALVVWRLFRGK